MGIVSQERSAHPHTTPAQAPRLSSGASAQQQAPTATCAQPLVDQRNVEKVTLVNGATCFVLTQRGFPRFFGASVCTPALWGFGEQHILEHVIVSGSKRYPNPAIFSALHNSSDLSLQAYTYPNHTCFTASALSDQGLTLGAHYLCDSMFFPKLAPSAILDESYKPVVEHYSGIQLSYPAGVVFNEMRQSYVHPAGLALWNAVRFIFPTAHSQQDFAGNPAGIRISATDPAYPEILREYHRRFYCTKNTHFFVSHPSDPGSILTLIEGLPPGPQRRRFRPPSFDEQRAADGVRVVTASAVDLPGQGSSVVLLIPTPRVVSSEQAVFFEVLDHVLFRDEGSEFYRRVGRDRRHARSDVSRCELLPLGLDKFLAIQVDGVAPSREGEMRELVSESYRIVNERKVSRAAFEGALVQVLHQWAYGPRGVQRIFEHVTERRWAAAYSGEELNVAATARALLADSSSSFQRFCRFVEGLFAQRGFSYIQAVGGRDGALAEAAGEELQNALPVVGRIKSELPLKATASQSAIVAAISETVEHEHIVQPYFTGDLAHAVQAVPVGDPVRIHLNVAFDLTGLRADLWMHAVALLESLELSSAGYRNSRRLQRELGKVASRPATALYPITADGCHFFWGVSILPESLPRFLKLFERLLQAPDSWKAGHLMGLDFQRERVRAEIYDPGLAEDLCDPFIARSLAYHDPGFRWREAVVGFEAVPRLNQLLSRLDRGTLKASQARFQAAARYLFSRAALQLHFSAPVALEPEVAHRLRDLYDLLPAAGQKGRFQYNPGWQIAKDEILVAPTVTNLVARVYQLNEFKPEHEVALTYLRIALSKELNSDRGFYLVRVRYDPTSKCLMFLAQRGPNAAAAVHVFDRIPAILRQTKISRAQLTGLVAGATMAHLDRIQFVDPFSTMVRRVRQHGLGLAGAEFKRYAAGISQATPQALQSLADQLETAEPRTVVLTGPAGAVEVQSQIPHIEFQRARRIVV